MNSSDQYSLPLPKKTNQHVMEWMMIGYFDKLFQTNPPDSRTSSATPKSAIEQKKTNTKYSLEILHDR